jgi:MoaA/NifB/PqqE/SkfB family radical SAM enzyme
MNARLVQLAASNFRKYGRQQLGSWTNSSIGQPTSIFATATNRCNLHCLQCDVPLSGNRKAELSTGEWKKIIRDLCDWLGTVHIRWSGGEPFVRRDMIDLIEYSSEIDALTGINTNGHYIDKPMAERLAAANVFNVNLSMDGLQSGHDHVRGSGQFQRVLAAARNLNEARRKSKADTKIIIRVTIMQTNLDELLGLCDLVTAEGFDAISFSPLEETFLTATPNKLWWQESKLFVRDLPRLDAIIDQLKDRTGANGPVFNSCTHLESMKDYFRQPDLPTPADFKCHVGDDHFRINFNGDVVMCPFRGTIGNLARQSPEQVWKSEQAEDRREDISSCRKKCLLGCLYKRSATEYGRAIRRLIR